MLLYGNAGPGGSLDRLSEDLLREARRLADTPATAAELQSVKKVHSFGGVSSCSVQAASVCQRLQHRRIEASGPEAMRAALLAIACSSSISQLDSVHLQAC